MGYGAGQIISGAVDFLSSESSPERLMFRRFKGDKLAEAIRTNSKSMASKDIDTVILKVNPENIDFSKRKIIQKVQTSAPGRFVVFDWGTELTIVTLSGNTGMLLPESITSGSNAIADTIEQVGNLIPSGLNSQTDPIVNNIQGAVTQGGALAASIVQDQLMKNLSYFEKLDMSPKYKAFKKLEDMFDICDADSDVLTLEMDNGSVYRGFFEDFSFSISAESPWNWKYTITFAILSDLAKAVRRWDEQYSGVSSNNDNKSNIKSTP